MNRNAPPPGLFLEVSIAAALAAFGVWFSRQLEEERAPLPRRARPRSGRR